MDEDKQRTNQEIIDDFLSNFRSIGEAMSAIQEREKEIQRQKSAEVFSTQANRQALIVAENISKTYKIGRQKVQAIKDLSTKIYEGEIVAITGSSGSGKSTLLQILGGLDKPTSGTVTVCGEKISHMSDRKLSNFRNRTIGFVFQFFYLQPFLKLETNLEIAGMPKRTKRKVRKEAVRRLAEATGLSDRLRHYPKELSGGQLQRAAIARALLNNPRIILADEPTGNLDSKNGALIIDLFEKIRKEFNTTIVIVTHDSLIANRADRIINIQDGVIYD